MPQKDELRAAIWRALLQMQQDCLRTIDLIEQLDAGTNDLLAEWEEMDRAYDHIHNVRRWVGRAWKMGPAIQPGLAGPLPLTLPARAGGDGAA